MFKTIIRSIVPVAAALTTALLANPAHARSALDTQRSAHPIDLVIALDVSGSMSGLIRSAKQRLWDVVNELDRAQPQPDLRVAVLSYGDPRYGTRTGYVRVDVPLTRDLDAVNAALFGFSTNGGQEYVARVIARATDTLQWSQDANALRIVFVAGNESATQDPRLSIEQVVDTAGARGIVVNAVYCGTDNNGRIPGGWRLLAQRSGGHYASIDQKVSAVAVTTTPYDEKLRTLNDELNETYVPYGLQGRTRHENQLEQDSNAAKMSAPAAASRAITKAGRAYRGAEWDLVDALESGVTLEAIPAEDLPPAMRAMSGQARAQHVEKKSRKREAIRAEIQQLATDRRAFIEREQAAADGVEQAGLADALKQGLKSAAKAKGFRFAP